MAHEQNLLQQLKDKDKIIALQEDKILQMQQMIEKLSK